MSQRSDWICDEDEIEIRAGSILFIYCLVNQVNKNIPLEKDIGDERQRLNAATIDVFLWTKRRGNQEIYRQTPSHWTRSIFY